MAVLLDKRWCCHFAVFEEFEIQAVLLTRPAAEWETLLIEAGVPAGRVLSVPEILSHPHLAERQFITRFPDIDPPQALTGGGYRISDGRRSATRPGANSFPTYRLLATETRLLDGPD